jgi:hypothetical protein
MSGHMRFGFAAFLAVAGFSTPAASNALTDLFSPSPAPEAASPAPAPAQDDCLPRPGEQTAAGQHWVYRYDGHRKCWFQAAEDSAVAKKPARRRAARHSVAAPDQDEPAPRRPKAVEDARAELVKSAPAEAPQPAPPAPEPTPSEPKLTIVHTIPVRVADAAAQVPPAPVRASSRADQLTPDQPAPRHVDVEKLLAEAPAASEAVASAAPATPIAARAAKTAGSEGWIASWLGVLLIALGGAALLSSSRTLRRALWPVRSPDSGTELPVTMHGDADEPFFARRASVSPASGETELWADDPQGEAAPVHAARPRRPVAPELPSHEALWEEGIGALAALTSPVSPEAFSGRRAMAYRGVEQRRRSSG